MKLFYELGEIFSLTCQKNYVFFVQILSPLKEISFESSFRFITIKFSHKLNAYEAKNKFRQTRAWDVLLVLTKVIEKYTISECQVWKFLQPAGWRNFHTWKPWPIRKSDFHMGHVEIWFLVISAIGDFTNFLKMYGNLSMAIAYTNSYRNIGFPNGPVFRYGNFFNPRDEEIFIPENRGPFGNCIPVWVSISDGHW